MSVCLHAGCPTVLTGPFTLCLCDRHFFGVATRVTQARTHHQAKARIKAAYRLYGASR